MSGHTTPLVERLRSNGIEGGQHWTLSQEAADTIDELLEAGQAVLARMSGTYQARNGRHIGIQGDDGEKCWIVHSDDIADLQRAIARARGEQS